MAKRKNNLKPGWVLLFLMVLAQWLIAAETVGGLLVDTSGEVSVKTKEGKSMPAFPGMQLEKGDMVITKKNTSAALILAYNNEVRHIPPETTFPVEKNVMPKHYSKLFSMVYEALHPYKEKIEAQQPILRDSQKEVMSLAVRPGGTSIMSQRPTFKWQKVTGADKYILKLMDEQGEIIWKQETTEDYLDFPPQAPGLSYDKNYFMQIEAMADNREIMSEIVHFQVLNPQKIEEVKQAQRRFEAEPLVLTSIYTHYNLNDLAISKLEQMVKKEPQNKYFLTMLKRLYLKKKYFQSLD